MLLRHNYQGYAIDISKTESSRIDEGKQQNINIYFLNLKLKIKGSYLWLFAFIIKVCVVFVIYFTFCFESFVCYEVFILNAS